MTVAIIVVAGVVLFGYAASLWIRGARDEDEAIEDNRRRRGDL